MSRMLNKMKNTLNKIKLTFLETEKVRFKATKNLISPIEVIFEKCPQTSK